VLFLAGNFLVERLDNLYRLANAVRDSPKYHASRLMTTSVTWSAGLVGSLSVPTVEMVFVKAGKAFVIARRTVLPSITSRRTLITKQYKMLLMTLMTVILSWLSRDYTANISTSSAKISSLQASILPTQIS